MPEPDADTATLCEHASALLMTTINGTQNNLSPEAVDKASELMHKARQVYCLGQGGSMYIANDICARFACISTKFRTAGDSHMQLITASLMTPEDVVLFVSYSGATRDMLETLRAAKAAGAKIILLTHYEDSPGAKLADIVLLCGAQELEQNLEPLWIDSRTHLLKRRPGHCKESRHWIADSNVQEDLRN